MQKERIEVWKITNQSTNEAEILLYDEIANFDDEEWGYTSAKGIINKIKALGNIKNFILRINSVGGNVFEAQAMYNYLKSHPANITVKIDGIAASAASLVAMAGNKIIMPENSLMMIHNPAGGCYGEAEEMREVAEILDKVRDTLAGVYIARTGLEREKVLAMMDDETWLTANEAHDLKFCDEVEKAVEITAMAVKGGTIFKSGFGFARVDDNLSAKLPKNAVKINVQNKVTKIQKEEKNEMDIKNVVELEKAYPELVAEIKNNAVNTERERLKTLDSLNAAGREAIIAKAKYEDPKDARDVAIELLTADKTQAQLNALYKDASSVNDVVLPQKTTPNAKIEEEAAINAVVNEINRMRGYK
ncbi:MAG: Clp protease ClpP [Synergistaceae bacterium]|nr:Clp protease ClpP [Synergistaceae bacterium]